MHSYKLYGDGVEPNESPSETHGESDCFNKLSFLTGWSWTCSKFLKGNIKLGWWWICGKLSSMVKYSNCFFKNKHTKTFPLPMYQNQEGVDFEDLYPWNELSILCPQRVIILENAFAVCCSTGHSFFLLLIIFQFSPWEKVCTGSWLKNKTKHNKTKANQTGNTLLAFSLSLLATWTHCRVTGLAPCGFWLGML